jgi:predicted Rossmann-fold nucleotide-binding protein
VPLILVGREFWSPLLKYINDTVYEQYSAIDKDDMKLYHLVDTAQEAYDIIIRYPPRKEVYY